MMVMMTVMMMMMMMIIIIIIIMVILTICRKRIAITNQHESNISAHLIYSKHIIAQCQHVAQPPQATNTVPSHSTT